LASSRFPFTSILPVVLESFLPFGFFPVRRFDC
jgi:hypothetical protein